MTKWIGLALASAVTLMSLAWQVQSGAADTFLAARDVQEAKVPEGDASAPDLDDYRAIIETLQEAIETRRDIDGVLSEVEAVIADLQDQQASATDVTTLVGQELQRIGTTLAGAVGAAGDSIEGLRVLEDRLARSEELARLIAEELEELDGNLGP